MNQLDCSSYLVKSVGDRDSKIQKSLDKTTPKCSETAKRDAKGHCKVVAIAIALL